jgi:hypothetical protein
VDRAGSFQSLVDRFEHKGLANYQLIIEAGRLPDVWLYDSSDQPRWPAPPQLDGSEYLFAAYLTFRFREQAGYAEYALRVRNDPDEHRNGESRQKTCHRLRDRS